jgi:regulator of sirC expression with transglutaminase-like and TPR domain
MTSYSNDKELVALISLLDEPDQVMLEKIRSRIFLYGTSVIPVLEREWENVKDDRVQQRIETLIHQLQQDHLFSDLKKWVIEGCIDLMKGFILVSRHQYPVLDEEKILSRINQIRQDIWLELNDNLTPLDKIKVINHVLYDVHKFTSNKVDILAPQNSYINTVLESKKGNPLSLGMIYLSMAQSHGIPVFGINLPQHFVLAYTNELVEKDQTVADEHDILFYINPFNRGAVFTRREIELFIKQLNLRPEKSFYYPCDNLTIIRRLIKNLKTGYENAGDLEKTDELDELARALD